MASIGPVLMLEWLSQNLELNFQDLNIDNPRCHSSKFTELGLFCKDESINIKSLDVHNG